MKTLFHLLLASMFLWACQNDKDFGSSNDISTSASLSTFTIVGLDKLCVLENNQVKVYQASADSLRYLSSLSKRWDEAETLFPFQDKLFVGTTTGMFIYDLSNAFSPRYVGQAIHARACDPVVTDGQYAYVTLREGEGRCFNAENTLSVYDVNDMTSPQLIKTYQMRSPNGLGIHDSLLIVCDEGVKVYNRSIPNNLELLTHESSFGATDVIVQNDHVVTIENEQLGVYQIDSVLTKISIVQ
ncbi:hypothetical protein OAH12_01380 [Cyclobacteriaceae bacterium]|nr:hypothetical protein [Cyclobacteriaceae bacterium]